uniref:Copia protein n=1 Tax=Tanacetum cinerariifolium TaxID=118510 RepID=A0A6L2LRY4_TANCI|nr:copia protein [Tanacetum cinerariifolium]
MLADFKLPTTFWAEAVNTACYMQNRVLVVKHHKKTPWELFHGRTPTLSFIRPFGCPVTILNTIDHLGKFDGKADEGFLVGYYLNSKPFRVFNSRTRIGEENFHISSTVNAAGTNEYNELPFDPNMLALEDVSIFNFSNDNEDDGIVANMNNLDTTIQFSLIPTTRIHKDHPLDQIIRDLHSATQTKNDVKEFEGTWIDYDEVFAPVARIEAIGLFLAFATFKDFVVYQVDVRSDFLYGKIEEEMYVCQPPGFEDLDFPDRVYKVEKALYGLHHAPRAWSMIGSLMYLTSSRPIIVFVVYACARYQVNPKVLHLHDVRRILDEVIHKKLGDSLVRAATTASSLEADQDSVGEEVFVAEQDVVKDDKGKGIMIEEPMKPKKKIKSDLIKKLLKGYKDDIHAKINADHQLAERLQAQEQEELSDANMEGYKLKDLKSKEFDKIQEMFDRAFKRLNTFEDIITELVKGKEKRAGEELIQESTKKQKVEDDKETAELKKLMEIIPYKEEVAIDAIPLAIKSSRIVDWKIHKEGKKIYYQIVRADGKSQMYMVFSKMLKSFNREDLEDLYNLGRIVRIKSLFDAVGITAAHIYVNTAQLELVLLVNSNEKYTKCLLILLLNGRVKEDVIGHIAKILEVLDSIEVDGLDPFQLRMITFLLSLSGNARKWWMNEGDGRINTWDELVSKFFSKLSIDRCPNHNMLLVTQIDTFYNGLTLSHRDTINDAAGGTFIQKTP